MGELPPVKLWVDEQKYVPRKITQASQVPIHLQEAAKASIQQDIDTGLIEKVAIEDNKWGTSRQVIVAKPTKPGEPVKIRRTVDYKSLNAS